MMWVSKVPNYDAYGLFRALHSHNPPQASSYYSNTGNSGIATVGTSAKVLCFASITKTSKASVFSSALKVFILFLLRFYEFQFLLMPVLFRG